MKRLLALFLSSLMLMSSAVYGSDEEAIHRMINLENDEEAREALEKIYEETLKDKSDFELVLLTSVCIAELYNRGLDKDQDFTDMSNSVTEYIMKYAANKKEEDLKQPWEKYLEENQAQPSEQPQQAQQYPDDYVRPELKEAVDSYLEFCRSFADFLANYDSGDSLDIIKYLQLLADYTEKSSKFEALDDAQDLTTAEQKLYTDALIELASLLININP